LLNVSKSEILCVAETFRPSSTNNSIHNSGYSLFRKDRLENPEGGGVCIFTNNEVISASQVFVLQTFSSLELVVIDVFLSTSATKCRLILCYRPPCLSDYSLDAITYTT